MAGRPAAFLDRDGTVIREVGYISDPAAVELISGAGEALRALQGAGYALIIVTNQSGLARGLFGLEAYEAVQRRLLELLEEHGVRITASYYCPHHPDFTGPCDCRKPGPGLYRRAAREHGIDLGRSLYVGDRPSDVEAGLAFGGPAALVRTGYGADYEDRLPEGVGVYDDLGDAVRALLGGIAPADVDTPGTHG